MFRQGDVLIVPVNGPLPTDAKRVAPDSGRVVLAYGEATGHAHALDVRDADLFESGGERFLQVRLATRLLHEEHAPIHLPEGLYRVVRQREYLPGEIRRVSD